jgi:hypothetical protein
VKPSTFYFAAFADTPEGAIVDAYSTGDYVVYDTEEEAVEEGTIKLQEGQESVQYVYKVQVTRILKGTRPHVKWNKV